MASRNDLPSTSAGRTPKPTLLILAAGPLQLPAIHVARRLGLRIVALDGSDRAPGLKLADVAYVVNLQDPAACLEIARREQVNGIVHICSEVAMHTMGFINEKLGLRGVDLATAVRATDKAQMRRAFATAGAPSPRSIGVSSVPEGWSAAVELGAPVIVKPSRNSGSRGVTRLERLESELVAHAVERAIAESRDHRAVVEEFVDGPEFSVECLVYNGACNVIAITDKVTTGAPYFVETGHSQPSRYSAADREAIVAAAVKGVRALGIDWAAAHAEVRLTPGGPRLIEIGARLGGDFITTELVPRSTGIDIVEGAIRLALGQKPDLQPRHGPRGAAIRYLTPAPGIVLSINGVATARELPGVAALHVGVSPGSNVPPIDSSLARVGHVVAEGATVAEAIARAEAARDTIEILTSPGV